jgi:hypothetical protein
MDYKKLIIEMLEKADCHAMTPIKQRSFCILNKKTAFRRFFYSIGAVARRCFSLGRVLPQGQGSSSSSAI